MKVEIDYEAIGQRVRAARIKKGYTQEKLANMIEITPTYVSSIENGSSKVALPTLVNIAIALDTTTDSLLYDITPVLVNQYDAKAKEILEDCTPEECDFIYDLMELGKKSFRTAITNNKKKTASKTKKVKNTK